ncbi:MAG: SpoIIE family protein phosphatase [Planctomycetota bacterium]
MFWKKKKAAAATVAPVKAVVTTPSLGDTTQFLTGETGQDRRNVQVLLGAIAGVSGQSDLEELLVDIVDRSIEITGAERGLLLLADGSELVVRVARSRAGQHLDASERFSTSIAKRVVEGVEPLKATVHSESEALELGKSVFDLKLRAVMCVPLAAETADARTRPSGVLYVDSRAATRQFSSSDLALFAALAQHISIALENAKLHLDSLEKVRLEQSLELASVIQRDLMPRVPTDLPGWDVHGWYGPAESAAGDFYDFVRLAGGGCAVVVGDVTGHGIGPALITAAAQAGMRSYLRLVEDPGKVVTLLNQDLCERVDDGRFITLFLAVLKPDGSLAGLNAGHSLPIVRRASGETFELGKGGGPAMGMMADFDYTTLAPILLEAGDCVVLYTDGLTEARDPRDHERMFGEDGLLRVLDEAASRDASARDTCMALVDAAMEVAGGVREDDVTVVVLRRVATAT